MAYEYGMKMTVTNAGADIVLRSLQEQKAVIFTGGKVGRNQINAESDIELKNAMQNLSDLLDPIAREASVSGKDFSATNVLTVTVEYNNAGQSGTWKLEEVGLFAKVDGDPAPVLFAYMALGNTPSYILEPDVTTIAKHFTFVISLRAGQQLAVTVEPTGLVHRTEYIDAEDITEALKLLD